MKDSKPIQYDIVTPAGLRTVAGWPVELDHGAGATFAIHADMRIPSEHPRTVLWTVAHIPSGTVIGTGSTRAAALGEAAETWAALYGWQRSYLAALGTPRTAPRMFFFWPCQCGCAATRGMLEGRWGANR